MAFKVPNPDAYAFLDDYRGKVFSGKWPTVVEMFDISVMRYGDRPCFTAFHPKEIHLTYSEVKEKVTQIANYLLATGTARNGPWHIWLSCMPERSSFLLTSHTTMRTWRSLWHSAACPGSSSMPTG